MRTTEFRFHFGKSIITVHAMSYTMARVIAMGDRAKNGLHFDCTKIEMKSESSAEFFEINNEKVSI